MQRTLFFIIFLLPFNAFAQFAIIGRVLNKADKAPVIGASVFLSNATTGGISTDKGLFILRNVKPGKYDLIVSEVGFETYAQVIVVSDHDLKLPDVELSVKSLRLKEVTIQAKTDPNRERYLNNFTAEFLGTSQLAQECKILNPDVLDFDYDQQANRLSASSYDFLIIENDALGYRIKYLLKDFSVETSGPEEKKVFYKGPYLFEKLKGTPADERRWERRRLQVYENSPMHFFRALLHDRLMQEGFLVKKLVTYPNPDRTPQKLIDAKIKNFTAMPLRNASRRDLLGYWEKKQKLPVTLKKIVPDTLRRKDLVTPGLQPGQFELATDNEGLVISYSQAHHFHITTQFNYLYNSANNETTFAKINAPAIAFYNNGALDNPYSLIYYGVWGRHRVAELLPIDYEPQANSVDYVSDGNVAALLRDFTAAHPVEKAYLQFNQPGYAAGDTLYFKAYVTAGERHELSTLSGVLNVDLINAQNKIDQSIKLQLMNGVAWGDFALPDSLPGGNYRVRAWTRWMRNDSVGFFEKMVPIGSLKASKTTRSDQKKAAIRDKPDLQFFPEGGDLVAGIKSKVAFKATGANGLGIDVSGQILDNENRLVATFQTTRLGMGSFVLDPQEGKTYKASVKYADGITAEMLLPCVLDKGINLAVNTDSLQKITVQIAANSSYYREHKNTNYVLLLYSAGTATTISCPLDSNVIDVELVRRKLSTGVNRITLLSPNSEPIAERLFFIQNYDQLSLNVSTDQTSYHSRDKVNLKIIAKTRADSVTVGHFSVAITDESKVAPDDDDEKTILSELLLTSELKGAVEQPNYYFITDSADENRRQKELDLVMLTNGYRRFNWKQVLDNTRAAPQYRPEKGLEINGAITSLLGKPIKGEVSLISRVGGPVLTAKTDDKGNFSFSNLIFNDTTHFVLSATNQKGKNTTKLIYRPDVTMPAVTGQLISNADTSTSMSRYLQNHEAQWDYYAKHGWPQGHLLKEVKIKAVKEDNHYESSSLLGPGHADQVMHAEEIEQIGGLLSTSLNGRLRGISFVKAKDGMVAWLNSELHTLHGEPMYVIIDGVEMGAGYPVDYVRSTNVETVEVLRFASASVYGSNGAGGALVITTKQGKGLRVKDIPSEGVLPITAKGFYVAREFYSPKYSVSQPDHRPDLRSTIYWKPELVTDTRGEATVQYYNADGTGYYRIVVEGIDENGNIGRAVYRYRVE